MKDRTSENNPQRTDDKNSISFLKIDKNIMKEDIPVLQRQVENGKVKATQLPRCQSQQTPLTFFKIFNLKIVSCLVNKLFPQRLRQPTEEKGKNRVHKQGIKLPLYKNRSFSKCFFFLFLFPLEHFFYCLCNKESSDCVTSSAFPDYTFWTYNCQATHILEGSKSLVFFFFLFVSSFVFYIFNSGPIICWEGAGSFEFRAAAILLVYQDWFIFFIKSRSKMQKNPQKNEHHKRVEKTPGSERFGLKDLISLFQCCKYSRNRSVDIYIYKYIHIYILTK